MTDDLSLYAHQVRGLLLEKLAPTLVRMLTAPGKGRRRQSPDLRLLLGEAVEHWDTKFGDRFGRGTYRSIATADWIREARQVLNVLSHDQPLDRHDVWRFADTARRLLAAFDVADDDSQSRLAAIEEAIGPSALPNLDQLRSELLAVISDQTQWVDLGGISPMIGSRVVQVPLDAVFTAPEFETDRDRSRAARSLEVIPAGADSEMALGLVAAASAGDSHDRPASRLPVSAILESYRSVVLGGPGSGKSTLARYVARTAAQAGSPAATTPILIRASDLGGYIARDPVLTLSKYIEHHWSRTYGPLAAHEIAKGRALVVIDGLDEVPDSPTRVRVARAIEAFASEHRHTRLLVTSRVTGYHSASLSGNFEVFQMAPLSDDQIARFVRAWLECISSESLQRADELLVEIRRRESVRSLAGNALLLTIIVLMWLRGSHLPARRAELYQVAAATLLEQWPLKQRERQFDREELISILGPVAEALLEEGASSISERDLREMLAASVARTRGLNRRGSEKEARQLIREVSEHTGFLVEKGYQGTERQFGFIHQTFAEYLAAREWSERWTAGTLRLSEVALNPRWREVLQLWLGHLSLWSPEQVSRAVAGLLEVETPLETHVYDVLELVLEAIPDGLRLKPDVRSVVAARTITTLLDAQVEGLLWRLTPGFVRASEEGALGDVAPLLRVRRGEERLAAARKRVLAYAVPPRTSATLRTALDALADLVGTAEAHWAEHVVLELLPHTQQVKVDGETLEGRPVAEPGTSGWLHEIPYDDSSWLVVLPSGAVWPCNRGMREALQAAGVPIRHITELDPASLENGRGSTMLIDARGVADLPLPEYVELWHLEALTDYIKPDQIGRHVSDEDIMWLVDLLLTDEDGPEENYHAHRLLITALLARPRLEPPLPQWATRLANEILHGSEQRARSAFIWLAMVGALPPTDRWSLISTSLASADETLRWLARFAITLDFEGELPIDWDFVRALRDGSEDEEASDFARVLLLRRAWSTTPLTLFGPDGVSATSPSSTTAHVLAALLSLLEEEDDEVRNAVCTQIERLLAWSDLPEPSADAPFGAQVTLGDVPAIERLEGAVVLFLEDGRPESSQSWAAAIWASMLRQHASPEVLARLIAHANANVRRWGVRALEREDLEDPYWLPGAVSRLLSEGPVDAAHELGMRIADEAPHASVRACVQLVADRLDRDPTSSSAWFFASGLTHAGYLATDD